MNPPLRWGRWDNGNMQKGKGIEGLPYDPKKHHRRSIRLKKYDYARSGAYFVTLCTYNRICLFGRITDDELVLNGVGQIVEFTWYDLQNHNSHIQLDAFTIMPNHIHGIIILSSANPLVGAGSKPALGSNAPKSMNSPFAGAGCELSPTEEPRRHGLPEIIRQFKTFSARRINKILNRSGASVWQRNYYERVIRDEKELNLAREYIKNNPFSWDDDEENPKSICKGESRPPGHP